MKLSIILFLIYSSFITNAQSLEDPILVKVGNLVISKSEFENRLNFTPHEGISDRNSSDGIKKELLYTMIAEKLWTNEAIEEGFENNPSVITAKNVIEKMFVRDELYKKEIKDKIYITDKEVKEADKRYSILPELTVFFSEKEKDIFKTFDSLNQLKSVEKVISTIDTNIVLYKDVLLSFGDLKKSTEDILYNLKVNQYTKPIKMETGWNIFYLKRKTERKFNSLKERSDAAKFIDKTLRKRAEDSNYNKFYSTFFKNKKVDVDGKLFMMIVNQLHSIFEKKEINKLTVNDKTGGKKILFDSYDLKELEHNLKEDTLSQVFIRFDKNPINLKTLLRELSFSSFSVPSSDKDSIKIYLNRKLKSYIKYEFLSREGYKKGLEKSPNVVKWVKIWYENFLYQMIKNNSVQLKGNSEKNEFTTNDEKLDGEKRFKDFIDKTIKLSDKFKYEINKKLFDSIKQGNINMFVIRNLGFGGSISGIPNSPPFIKWYLEKEKKNSPDL